MIGGSSIVSKIYKLFRFILTSGCHSSVGCNAQVTKVEVTRWS